MTSTVIGMFTHDNRVIHNDTQRDDQTKKADHINRQSTDIHQSDCSHQGNGNTRGNPECGACIEE